MTSAAAVLITGHILDEAFSVCTWVFGDNGAGKGIVHLSRKNSYLT